MKASILAGGIALCSLASPALASPLEARDGRTHTVTTTQTAVSTKWRTTTATETLIITKTRTRMTTQTETTTKTDTKTRTKMVFSTVTVPTTQLVTVTKKPSTLTVQGPTVTSMSSVRGPTVTAPGKTVTLTSLSTKTIPGPTITDLSIATVQGPTVTAVSTQYVGNGTRITLSKTITFCPLSTSATTIGPGNIATSAASSSAAATTSSAPTQSYFNVITSQCSNPKAYYIQLSNTGTKYDGTVLMNEKGRNGTGAWVTYDAPSSEASVSPQAPQPFTYDSSTGFLMSYWNPKEMLQVFPGYGDDDGRAGIVGSLSDFDPLKCTLVGNVLTNLTSIYTNYTLAGVQIDYGGGLHAAGGLGYNAAYMTNVTLSLVGACDI